MANIETYDTGRVTLQKQAQPTPSSAPAQQLGSALAGLGEQIGKAGAEYDILTAKKADTEFRNKLLEAGMGENGYYRKRGEDAVTSFEAFKQSIAETKRQQLAGIKSPRARQILGDAIDRQANAELERGYAHYLKQLDVAQESATAGQIASSVNYAAAHWNDDDTVLSAMQTIDSELTDLYRRQGLNEKDIAARVLSEQSKLVETMAATAQQFGVAEFEGVYAKYEQFLDAPTRSKIEAKLAEMKVSSAAIEMAEDALAKGGSLSEQYARLDAIEDPEIRKAARSTLKQLVAERNQVRADAERQMLDEEVQKFRADPNYTVAQNLRYDAPAKVVAAMQKMENARKKELRGEKRKSSLSVVEYLSSLSQEELANVTLAEYEPSLSEADAARFAKLIGEAKKPDPLMVGEVRREDARGRAGTAALTMFPKTAQKAQRQAFADWVEEQLRGVKDPTYEDLDAIIERGAKQYIVDEGAFWNTRARAYEIDDPAQIKDLPDDDKALVREGFLSGFGADLVMDDEFVSKVFVQHQQTGVPFEDIGKIYAGYRQKNGRDPTDMELKARYREKVRRNAQ